MSGIKLYQASYFNITSVPSKYNSLTPFPQKIYNILSKCHSGSFLLSSAKTKYPESFFSKPLMLQNYKFDMVNLVSYLISRMVESTGEDTTASFFFYKHISFSVIDHAHISGCNGRFQSLL